jgi:hypothetical protein
MCLHRRSFLFTLQKQVAHPSAECSREAYSEAFLANYQDNPANPLSQRVLDPRKYFSRRETMPAEIKCVHGHFHPGKFELTGDIVLLTEKYI